MSQRCDTPSIDKAIEALKDAEAAMAALPDLARPPIGLLGGHVGLTPQKVADEIERLEKIRVHILAAVVASDVSRG